MGELLKMKSGKINVADLAKKINKKMGMNVAHDLSQSDPVSVKDWIPTGSKWLDLIVSPGQEAGIPVGKITELAGLSGSGKSFMAAQIAANAQKKGMFVVYFDAESAIDPEFLEKAGCSKDQLLVLVVRLQLARLKKHQIRKRRKRWSRCVEVKKGGKVDSEYVTTLPSYQHRVKEKANLIPSVGLEAENKDKIK